MEAVLPTRVSRTEVISNIQALRAWAALGVVYYHTAFVAPGMAHTDFLGVTIFFAISGFIMTHITRDSSDGFMTARLIRIVPLYWIATIAMLIWTGCGFANPYYTVPVWSHMVATSPMSLLDWFQTQLAALFDRDMLSHLTNSAFFLPSTQPPVLGVGWTLNLEMFFYVAFWLSLQVSRRFAPLIVCGVLIAFKSPPLNGVVPLYGHAYTTSFIAGVAVYYAWRGFLSFDRRLSREVVVPLTLGFVAVASAGYLASATYRDDLFPGVPLLLSVRPDVTFPALLVLSALMLHSIGIRITAPWMLLLGDASYALYLFHGNVIETMRTMSTTLPWLDFTRHATAAFAALILSCLLAVAVHRWVEKPVLRVLRNSVRRLRRSTTLPPVIGSGEVLPHRAE
jgi:exopolysaccharide production protein ExoZ